MVRGDFAKIFLVFILISASFVLSADADGALVKATYLGQSPDPVEPGDYVEVRWRVENFGGGETYNYVFELDADYPLVFDKAGTKQQNLRLSGYQNDDDSAIVYWRLRVADDAVEGNETNVRLRYWAESAKEGTLVSLAKEPIRVQSKATLLEIAEAVTVPEEVRLGKSFDMKIVLKNKGSNFVDSVKVNVDVGDTGITPIGYSNEKIIDKIIGNSEKEVLFSFFVNSDTEVKVHSIPVTITYEDKFGDSYTAETEVGVVIDGSPDYLTNLETSEIYMDSQKGKIVVSISNIGKSSINFVVLEMVESEDYEIISSPKTYLGNLDSDDFETGQFDIYIHKTKEDEVPLKFRIYYKDSYDQVFDDFFVLNQKIYSKGDAKKFGLISSGGGSFFFILLLLLAAGGGFWWWRKKSRKHLKLL